MTAPRLQRALLLVSVISCLLSGPARGEDSRLIVVLKSSSIAYFDEVIPAFQQALPDGFDTLALSLNQDEALIPQMVLRIRAASPALIVALGDMALNCVIGHLGEYPVVYAAAERPQELLTGKALHSTGISMYPDLTSLGSFLLQFSPALTHPAVLYDPEDFAEMQQPPLIEGLTWLPKPLTAANQMPVLLSELPKDHPDVLILMPERTLLNEINMDLLWDFSMKYMTPLIGITPRMDRRKAALFFESSAEQLGVQTAELCLRCLSQSPEQPPPGEARKYLKWRANANLLQQFHLIAPGNDNHPFAVKGGR